MVKVESYLKSQIMPMRSHWQSYSSSMTVMCLHVTILFSECVYPHILQDDSQTLSRRWGTSSSSFSPASRQTCYWRHQTWSKEPVCARHLLTRLYQNSNHVARRGYHYVQLQSTILYLFSKTSMPPACLVLVRSYVALNTGLRISSI